jgi:ribosomal protein L12E/L44/L45/RPP1/RPP2
MEDLQSMLDKQLNGESWKDIFTAYNRNHPEFTPRSFESDLLEKLMNKPNLSADDIMIADRLSFVTGKQFEEIVEQKQTVSHWYEITSVAGILFSADKLPRVQITSEQLRKYKSQTDWSDDRITAAFVVANQVGQEVATVIEKLKGGYSVEAVFAEVYEAKHR